MTSKGEKVTAARDLVGEYAAAMRKVAYRTDA